MRIRLLGLLIIIFSNSCDQATLKARIDNLPEGNVYLWNTTTGQIDSLEIVNYAFTYKTYLTEPTLFYVKFEGYNDWDYPLRIILSNDLTSMRLNELKRVMQGTWKDIYPNKPDFHNDPNLNKRLFEFETAWQVFSDSISKLSPGSGDNEIFLTKRRNLYNEFIQSSDELIKDNPDKMVSAVVVFEYLIRNRMIDTNKTKESFQQFDDVVKYSVAGTKIWTHINKELSIEVGKLAPHFEFLDIKGYKHDLSQFKNKTVMLHFWSSTCGPCRVENKKIKELNASYNEGIVIINVSLDTNEIQWKKAVENDGLSEMLNTSDLMGTNNKMVQDYYIHGIPTHYLIDKGGRILSKGSLDEVKSRLIKAR